MKKNLSGYDIAIAILIVILSLNIIRGIGKILVQSLGLYNTIWNSIFDLTSTIIVFGTVIFSLLWFKKQNKN